MSNVIDFQNVKAKKDSEKSEEETSTFEKQLAHLETKVDDIQIGVAILLSEMDTNLLTGALAIRVLSDRIKKDNNYDEEAFNTIVNLFIEKYSNKEVH